MATRRRHKFETAVAAILSSKTIKEASAKCGVNYNTLLVWLRTDKLFQEIYNAAKKELLDDVKNSIRQSAITGVAVLQDALNDETESPLARLPAAKFAIESAINLEISDSVLAKIDGKDDKKEWDCILPTNNDDQIEGD